MSKEEVYEFIKEKTFGKGIKITAQEMLRELKINEATLYKNLNSLSNWPDVYYELVRRKYDCLLCDKTGTFLESECPNCKGKGYNRKYNFKEKKWWIE